MKKIFFVERYVTVMNYQVLFFEETNGDVPVEEFINSLDVKMSAKAYRLLMMISENGPDLREPYSKFLEDGIFELRVQQGSDISRVLYFFMSGKRIVLLTVLRKKPGKHQGLRLIKLRLTGKNI